MPKTLVIIPAFNEEQNIERVLYSLHEKCPNCDLLVVNDGSKDLTEKIVRELNFASLINLKINLGIGGAVQSGFKFAKKFNYDIAIQFDGDGQHNSDEINKLIEPIISHNADMVIGSRFIDNQGFQSTFTRRIGIFIFEILNSILIGQRISDNTSGFRAYSKRAIEYLADNYPQDYPEPENVIIMAKKGFRIFEIPVIMNKRDGGKSSIYGLKSAYYMIKVILSILITSIRKI